ncbi:UNVERIFIED_CONTAM: hypothetical protein HDU68_010207 [Siphonaria sp. JEL0065]|nr:hypothetical protein HDU68_010207 [Siphonaria sp. JEL0065]
MKLHRFSGINAAIQIKKMFPTAKLVLYEKGNKLGGAWHWNQYPGCACDVPSHLYSLSYELNPDWDQHYPSAESIQKYLERVAKKHGVYDVARLNTHVQHLEWQQDTNQWKLISKKQPSPQEPTTEYFDFVFTCIGPLHVPKTPQWNGMETFKGDIIHTARWSSEFNPSGKRIAVIGTGASGVQVIPELVKVADSVTVFQRTANWIGAKVEYKYSAFAKW